MRELHTELRIVPSLNVRQISLDPYVIQSARFFKSDWLIRERIGTGGVFDVVESVVRINRQYRRRAKDVHVPWRQINSMNQLSLVLAERSVGQTDSVSRSYSGPGTGLGEMCLVDLDCNQVCQKCSPQYLDHVRR